MQMQTMQSYYEKSIGFDEVWRDGLILKLKQNWISGSFIKFFRKFSV